MIVEVNASDSKEPCKLIPHMWLSGSLCLIMLLLVKSVLVIDSSDFSLHEP